MKPSASSKYYRGMDGGEIEFGDEAHKVEEIEFTGAEELHEELVVEESPQVPVVEESLEEWAAEESLQEPVVEESPQVAEVEECLEEWAAEESPQVPAVEESPQEWAVKEGPRAAEVEECLEEWAAEECLQEPVVEQSPQEWVVKGPVVEKLRELGVCVAGFQWQKIGDSGYRCAGGSHFISSAQLGLDL